MSIFGNWWSDPLGNPDYATAAQKAEYLQAVDFFNNLELPDLMTGSQEAPVLIFNFDGTGNAKVADPGPSDKPSNIAQLDDLLQGLASPTGKIELVQYIQGIGTGGAFIDIQQAVAFGAVQRVKDALISLARWKLANPTETPYVLVTGFSRGSAEARLFMNVLDRYGIPALGDTDNDLIFDTTTALAPPGVVRMSALLFDTVVTSMGGEFGSNLDSFGIPASVDSVVHITSDDERRVFFPLTSTQEAGTGVTNRLIEVRLPGVHSAIGGGYDRDGVAKLNLYFAKQVLNKWGIPVAADLPDLTDNETWVVHDSRTLGTKIYYKLKGGEPNGRIVHLVDNEAVTSSEDIDALNALYGVGGWATLAQIPAALQSPQPAQPGGAAPGVTLNTAASFSNFVTSVKTFQDAMAAGLAASAGVPAGEQWFSGYSNVDATAVATAVEAATKTFQSLWGADVFQEDLTGNIVAAREANYADALELLSGHLSSEAALNHGAGKALNTAALFASTVYGLGQSTSSDYLSFRSSAAGLGKHFSTVLAFYDKSNTTYNVKLADAYTNSGLNYLTDEGDSRPAYFVGFDGVDLMQAGVSGSRLFGGKGNDQLWATSGGVTLEGGEGDDILIGSTGKDIYVVAAGEGNDTVRTNGGPDQAHLTGGHVDFRREGLDVIARITTDDGDPNKVASLRVLDWFTAGTTSAMMDTIFANQHTYSAADITSQLLTVNGSADADVIAGLAGYADIIFGNGGDDIIDVAQDSDVYALDVVHGGAGNDRITNGAGAAQLYGDASNDTINGGTGAILVDGGDGNDILTGYGSTLFRGGEGNDTITSYGVNAQVYGDAGNDVLNLRGSNSTAYGGVGSDRLINDGSQNTFYGGAGADSYLDRAGGARYVWQASDGLDLAQMIQADTVVAFESNRRYTASRNEIDLVVTDVNGGGVTFRGWFTGNNRGLIELPDGSVWSPGQIDQNLSSGVYNISYGSTPIYQASDFVNVMQSLMPDYSWAHFEPTTYVQGWAPTAADFQNLWQTGLSYGTLSYDSSGQAYQSWGLTTTTSMSGSEELSNHKYGNKNYYNNVSITYDFWTNEAGQQLFAVTKASSPGYMRETWSEIYFDQYGNPVGTPAFNHYYSSSGPTVLSNSRQVQVIEPPVNSFTLYNPPAARSAGSDDFEADSAELAQGDVSFELDAETLAAWSHGADVLGVDFGDLSNGQSKTNPGFTVIENPLLAALEGQIWVSDAGSHDAASSFAAASALGQVKQPATYGASPIGQESPKVMGQLFA